MNCPKCNNVIEQGSSFCTSCGFNLVNGSANLQEQPVFVDSNQNQNNVETLTDTNLGNDFSNQNVSQSNSVNETNQNVQPNSVNGLNQNVQPNSVNGLNQNVQPNSVNGLNQNVQPNSVNGLNQNVQPNLPINNMSNVSTMNNNMGNMNNNFSNMNYATAGNGVGATKANNTSIIIIVIVIALVAIGICYFMLTKNASSDNKSSNTNAESTVAVNDNEVSVNGLTGNVPKNWSFVSGEEIGDPTYDGAFVNDTMNSFTFIGVEKTTSFAIFKQNINSIKANLEANGISDLNYNIETKDGIEYILFEGIYSGSNYHIFVKANSVGVIFTEGVHSSASDLNTIVDFNLSLKSSTGSRAMSGISSPKFSTLILGK